MRSQTLNRSLKGRHVHLRGWPGYHPQLKSVQALMNLSDLQLYVLDNFTLQALLRRTIDLCIQGWM